MEHDIFVYKEKIALHLSIERVGKFYAANIRGPRFGPLYRPCKFDKFLESNQELSVQRQLGPERVAWYALRHATIGRATF